MQRIVPLLLLLVLSASAASYTQSKSVEYINSIKELVIATQKTRGATYNFLNGSEFAQFAVFEQRSKAKRLYRSLKKQHAAVDAKTNERMDDLGKKLRHLNRIALELEPIVAFKAYSVLVKNMIDVGGKTSDTVFAKGDAFSKQVSSFMMTKLLPLTESVGKVRGIGSGVIARSYCEEHETELLTDYIDELKQNLTAMTGEINKLIKKNKKYPTSIKLDRINSDIHAYITLVETKVIDQDKIALDPNKYFDQGTAIISKVLAVYDTNEALLK